MEFNQVSILLLNLMLTDILDTHPQNGRTISKDTCHLGDLQTRSGKHVPPPFPLSQKELQHPVITC